MQRAKQLLAFFCAFAATAFLFACSSGCSTKTADTAAVSAADVVNTIAHRGDQLYALSVTTCNAAEQGAAELNDVTQAKALVAKIRAKCDAGFAAIGQVKQSIDGLDTTMARVQAGTLTAQDLVSAALSARTLFESTQTELSQLATWLEHPTL